MRKRKINLLIVSQDSSALGGAEVLLTTLANGFVKQGVNVSVLSNYKPFLNIQRKNITPIYVPFRMDIAGNIRGFVKFILQMIPAIFWYGKIVKAYAKSDGGLILISGFSEKLIITPLAKIYKLPILWLEHGPLEELFGKNFGIPGLLYKTIEKSVLKIVTPSANTKNHLVKDANISIKKITVISNGIEIKSVNEIKRIRNNALQIKRKIDKTNNGFLVGMVSRIQKEKGQDTAIEAMSILCKRYDNIKLVIVGGGPELDKYKKYARQLNLGKNVIFPGYVSDEQKWRYYSIFDVCLFPTRWEIEGFGIVLLEAMMMGAPIIASNFGPVPEVVGDAGLLVKPDAEGVAGGIEKMYKDKHFCNKIIGKEIKRVKKFDTKIATKKYLEVFEELLIANDKDK